MKAAPPGSPTAASFSRSATGGAETLALRRSFFLRLAALLAERSASKSASAEVPPAAPPSVTTAAGPAGIAASASGAATEASKRAVSALVTAAATAATVHRGAFAWTAARTAHASTHREVPDARYRNRSSPYRPSTFWATTQYVIEEQAQASFFRIGRVVKEGPPNRRHLSLKSPPFHNPPSRN
jgi:hypothetical protein